VRAAAKLNGLPVDNVAEIPADIKAEPRGAVQNIATGNHRYLVKRVGTGKVLAGDDAKYGVKPITSYATADQQYSLWVYEAASFSAVESAAKVSGERCRGERCRVGKVGRAALPTFPTRHHQVSSRQGDGSDEHA
jgi:hypothetical protein